MRDTICIWKVQLGEESALWEQLLSPDERERAQQFRRPRDQREFVVCRGALRLLLGTFAGRDPAALRFAYGAHEKPALEDEACSFNVSRSHRLAAIAITSAGRIGVDLERVRPVDVDALADEYLPAADRAILSRVAPADRARAFFALWVRREALVKATGGGIVVPADRAVPEADGLWLRDLDLAPGYCAALAADGDRDREVVIRDLDWGSESMRGREREFEQRF